MYRYCNFKPHSLSSAMDKLAGIFAHRNWEYLDTEPGSPWEKTFHWPGLPEEDIMICVHKGNHIHETFHRQDFFFFNYAYQGNYGAASERHNHYITVQEGECCMGQPHTGYALNKQGKEEFIILGVLMRKEAFYRSFLPVLSADAKLFHFFLAPRTNSLSDEFIHLKLDKCTPVRPLLEMMVTEYAFPGDNTQAVLKPLVLALLMHVARQYRQKKESPAETKLSDRIIRYMNYHTDAVTLKEIARHFSYHPNYISTLLRRETKKTFSEILLELRMKRADILLKETSLSVDEIACMLGYSNSSNFYKAFREYYHVSPRKYERSF